MIAARKHSDPSCEVDSTADDGCQLGSFVITPRDAGGHLTAEVERKCSNQHLKERRLRHCDASGRDAKPGDKPRLDQQSKKKAPAVCDSADLRHKLHLEFPDVDDADGRSGTKSLSVANEHVKRERRPSSHQSVSGRGVVQARRKHNAVTLTNRQNRDRPRRHVRLSQRS
jgi:hypothetical protein